MYRISYRFLVPGWSAKPLVSAHDRIMGTHTLSEVPGHPTAAGDNTPRAIYVTGGYSPTRRGEQPAPTLPRQSRSTR